MIFLLVFILNYRLGVLQSFAPQPMWRAITPSGERIELDDSTKAITLFVFYSSYACHDCFHELNDAISSLKGSFADIRTVVLIRGNPSIRRLLLHDSKIDFPECHEFYYDITDPSKLDPSPPIDLGTGLWGAFGVGYSPSVAFLLFKKGKPFYKYISFDGLFGPEVISARQKVHATLSSRIFTSIQMLRN